MKLLTKNQLKILAMVCMTLDHIGAAFFPQAVWLRVIGRLAFPLFSYCIAEGCRYTRNKARYFGSVFACGAVCVIAFLPFGGFCGNALITLSMSILLLYGVEAWKSSGKLRFLALTAALAAVFYLLCRTVYIDYGFAEAATTYGRIGVKVWIYKGEVLTQALRTTPRTLDTSKPYQERRERRDRRNGDRRGGFNRDRRDGGFNRGPRSGGQGNYNNNRGPRPAGQANAPKEGGAQ